MTRPWSDRPIRDCGESLQKIPPTLFCLKPHPYLSVGAPYSDEQDPFRLREGVLFRLLKAQKYLANEQPNLRFAIFDAWRPISVQEFMIEYLVNKECLNRKLNRYLREDLDAVEDILKTVHGFWAPPSKNPLTPPPHSTGAAVDLTLSTNNGIPLNMGGEIDEISPVSEPNYYAQGKEFDVHSEAYVWHSRRILLKKVMNFAGFVQHPKEWWHFSFGDQLWAWSINAPEAIYGSKSN